MSTMTPNLVSVRIDFQSLEITGYVQVYPDTLEMAACMDTSCVFALRAANGGHTPEDVFSYACGLMIDQAAEILNNSNAIVNLTQHTATLEQVEAGVFEPVEKALAQKTMTFEGIPSKVQLHNAAITLAIIAKQSGAKRAMIGGAPFFMSTLEKALIEHGITPLYAFSERVSAEEALPDGTVRKTNIFKHVGFVEV